MGYSTQTECEICGAKLLDLQRDRCLKCGASTSIPTPSSAQRAYTGDLPTSPGQIPALAFRREDGRDSKVSAVVLAAAIMSLTFFLVSVHACSAPVHKVQR